MWYNLIFVLVVFIAIFIGFTGYSQAKDNNNNSALDQLSRSEYTNKLKQLPQNPDSWNKPVGAMCYKTSAPPERVEYICPICGEMTLYPVYSTSSIDRISYYRTLVKKITKINVKLDESQLCKKCSPDIQTRKLCLIVKYDKSSKPHKTCNITEEDISLLYDYSEGVRKHSTSFGEIPLTTYKTRLEELLGVKIKNDEK